MHAVVTTTIHDPKNLADWAVGMTVEDAIIVAGDLNGPHEAIIKTLDDITGNRGIQTLYVAGHGAYEPWAVGSVIGWRSIQRRNIAILEAMKMQPDFITTIDTDNYPSGSNHLKTIRETMDSVGRHDVVHADTGWLNVGEFLAPPVIHRGYPMSRRHTVSDRVWTREAATIGVHASLWAGDPDIDAIERIHADPQTQSRGVEADFVLGNETWCPFNSQATTYRRELFPLLCVWPFVGRMDDIWPSYVAKQIMRRFNYQVAYGRPFVRQDRNPHDLIKDLEAEILGYRYTDAFIEGLRRIDLSECTNVLDALGKCLSIICRQSFIPPALSLFFDKWLRDLDTLQSQYAVSFE